MKSLKITKRASETHREYVRRKLNAAAKEGVKFAVCLGFEGRGEIYADSGVGALALLVIVDSTDEGRSLVSRIEKRRAA